MFCSPWVEITSEPTLSGLWISNPRMFWCSMDNNYPHLEKRDISEAKTDYESTPFNVKSMELQDDEP